jgi:hypothetical protein
MIPTKKGDVLIVRNDTIPTWAVAVVLRDGAQDLKGRTDHIAIETLDAAVEYATVFTAPGAGCVFVSNVDTGEWYVLG